MSPRREEIRYLAGRTAPTARLWREDQIPLSRKLFLQDCMAMIQRLAGAERGEVTPPVLAAHLLAVAQPKPLWRLSGQPSHPVTVASERVALAGEFSVLSSQFSVLSCQSSVRSSQFSVRSCQSSVGS